MRSGNNHESTKMFKKKNPTDADGVMKAFERADEKKDKKAGVKEDSKADKKMDFKAMKKK